MNILKNRHLLVASLVAPLLALMAYFSIDFLFGEKPSAAVAGQSYPLAEKPDCRYGSGHCGLKNGDFELELRVEAMGSAQATLMLKSVVPLEGVKVALVSGDAGESEPAAMQAQDSTGLYWSLPIRRPDPERDRLQLVAAANQSLYFGDASTAFVEVESR